MRPAPAGLSSRSRAEPLVWVLRSVVGFDEGVGGKRRVMSSSRMTGETVQRGSFVRRLVRVERHALGPRIFVFGVRWHDWHFGLLVLVGLAIGFAVGLVHETLPAALAALAGAWLVAKDWRDLTRRRRDTAAWRLGLHRYP